MTIIKTADHSMHHSMHGADHTKMDHLTVMSSTTTTTTTEMPANVHLHHDMPSMHEHHVPAASSGHTMLHHAMSMSVSSFIFVIIKIIKAIN